MRRLTFLLCVLLTACTTHRVLIIDGTTASAEQEPFPDGRDPRLERAEKQASALLGHALRIELDQANFPLDRRFYEELFERGVGQIPASLEFLKKRYPRVFKHAAARLSRVQINYQPPKTKLQASFDHASGLLILTVSDDGLPGSYHYRSRSLGIVGTTLKREYEEHLERRYRGKSPAALTPAQYDEYFAYLTDIESRFRPGKSVPPEEQLVSGMPFKKLQWVAELALLARRHRASKELRQELQVWLLRQQRTFSGAYMRQPERTRKLPASAHFRLAEKAWVAWLNKALPRLSAAEKTALLPPMVVRLRGQVQLHAFPGFDLFKAGADTARAWLRRGAPANQKTAEGRLVNKMICPVQRVRDGTRRPVVGSCNRFWYRQAIASPAGRKRMLALLKALDDVRFTEVVFTALMREGSDPRRVLELWRGLEPRAKQWAMATRVIADAQAGRHLPKEAYYTEAQVLWRRYPGRRGSLLYLLARVYARYDNGPVDWANFRRDFGAPIGASAYAAYLREGYFALEALPRIWPALAPRFSRVGPLMRSYASIDKERRRYRGAKLHPPLVAVMQQLCAESSRGQMDQLAAHLRNIVAAYPTERSLLSIAEMPSRCRPPRKKTRPGKLVVPSSDKTVSPW